MNIDKFFKDLENDVTGLDKSLHKIVENLTNEAYEQVVSRCNETNLGNHIGNITRSYDPISNTGTISTDDEVIIFKEYGTGRIGSETAGNHKGMITWDYMTNPEHADGWYYPTDESDPNPYKFKSKSGEWIAFTKGLESEGMFYETYLDIKDRAGVLINTDISKIK